MVNLRIQYDHEHDLHMGRGAALLGCMHVVVSQLKTPSLLRQAFQEGLGPMPNTIVAPCCGQFAVAKDRILAHPPSFYAGLVEWLLEVRSNVWAAAMAYVGSNLYHTK